MQVAHLHAVIRQVFGQVLCHALGERGDQHTLVLLYAQVELRQHIVDLVGRWSDLYLRVYKPRRTHHLLHDLARVVLLVVGRRRRDEHGLPHDLLEFVEPQRAVIQRRRQAEPVLDKVFLARAIALVHATQLTDRHVALVDHHQRIVRQVIDQRGRGVSRLAAGKVARVIFDPLAETELVEHLEVEPGALLDPLRFDQPGRAKEVLDPVGELELDRVDCLQGGRPRGHVVAGRVHRKARQALQGVARQRVEERQRFYLVVEQRNAHRVLRVLGREHVDDIAAHPERAAPEVHLVAVVLHRREALDDVTLGVLLAHPQVEDHGVVFGRVTNTVDRRDRRHDHDVAAFHQRLGCRKSHLLDVLVDRGVLLDEQVPRRHIGFRLVVVVVGNEVLDGVFREELAHLGIQLRRERLVRREHHGRTAELRNHVGHRVGLARPGDAEERLESQPVVHPFDQLFDRLRLVAGGRIRLVQPERAARIGDEVGYVGWGYRNVPHRERDRQAGHGS